MNYFEALEQTVALALAEDIGSGDLTAALVDPARTVQATVITREAAIVCGRPWVDEVFKQVDTKITVEWAADEGQWVAANDVLFRLSGPATSLLTAERTALNFLQLLSGTATATRRAADALAQYSTTLLDTRKTIPGLRLAQKYAVKTGGGDNHRIGLFDAFLIKENHIEAAGSIAAAVSAARAMNKSVRIEVEVENLQELDEAIAAGPDWIMLDNFSLQDMSRAVTRCQPSGIRLESSGGIESFEKMQKIAATGVDFISVGALTKHIEAIDLSMRIE